MTRYGRRELGEAHYLEHRGSCDAVDASTASGLELVNVMEQGGGLDEAHVDRDPCDPQHARRLAGDAGNTFRVADDARREAPRGKDPARLLGVRYGHAGMLPVGSRRVCEGVPVRARVAPRATPLRMARPRVETVQSAPSVSTPIEPSRSVRSTCAPAALSVLMVIGAG